MLIVIITSNNAYYYDTIQPLTDNDTTVYCYLPPGVHAAASGRQSGGPAPGGVPD